MLLPDCHQRIVALFRCEGKRDDVGKSRLFNNLACTLRAGLAFIPATARAEPIVGMRLGGPCAIVVLVE